MGLGVEHGERMGARDNESVSIQERVTATSSKRTEVYTFHKLLLFFNESVVCLTKRRWAGVRHEIDVQ